jgi:alpha-amylase/alpha-mannosidase (GH57 family)
MAVHLETCPGAAAVVNFSPVLLEQLADFNQQLGAHLRNGTALRNRVLRLLVPDGVPSDAAERDTAIRACLRANRERLIERFGPYRELAALAQTFLRPGAVHYAADDFIVDLAVWYHIAWLGETVRLGDPRVETLIAQARHFDAQHCRTLLEIIADVLSGLIPRYRRLFGSGQVELSVTPYGHPIGRTRGAARDRPASAAGLSGRRRSRALARGARHPGVHRALRRASAGLLAG